MWIWLRYRPGRKNSGADALSRLPVHQDDNGNSTLSVEQVTEDLHDNEVFVTAVAVEDNAKSGERSSEESNTNESTRDRQQRDPELKLIVDYLEKGDLPKDDKKARDLVLGRSLYQVIGGILYHMEPDKSLRLIPPDGDRERLFHEVHSGIFGAHLKDVKIHGELSKHYWWPKMRADICKWCRSCLVCVTRQAGRVVQPPLTPIPVYGPFHRVGVDVIQFPKSHTGNRYGIVFVDYLTKWPEVFATSDQTALTIAKLFVEQIVCRHGVQHNYYLIVARHSCHVFLWRFVSYLEWKN